LLQPELFRKLRAELADLWTPEQDWRFARRQAFLRAKIRQERPQKYNKSLRFSPETSRARAEKEKTRKEDERRERAEEAERKEDALAGEEQPSAQVRLAQLGVVLAILMVCVG
jgi:hypothetical protein